ncbi:MAG: hypothetical protein MJK14_17040 [Rivularia sp. ALOHA_DT_140]|nr:hypothetical protein [Rivularia sp. ALOHA_DT_140]
MEKLIIGSIILLFVFTGLIFFLKDIITAVKNPSFKKQGNKYYIQPTNWWHGMANYQNNNIYDSSSSCDSGSFDIGGDRGGGE